MVDAIRQRSVDAGIPAKLEAMKEENLGVLSQSAFAHTRAYVIPRKLPLKT